MPLGTLTLHRFNGDEIFNVSDAAIRYFVDENGVTVDFQVSTENEPVKTLPDTEELDGHPTGAWQLLLPTFDPDTLAGKSFSIPQGYNQDEEYVTNFYYIEHETIDENEIVFLEREGERYQVRITGNVTDVNYQVVVEASFSLVQTTEPIDPIG